MMPISSCHFPYVNDNPCSKMQITPFWYKKNQLWPIDHPLTNKLQFIGQFVNSLCVGRTHESADPLQFLTQFLVCYRRFFAKQEPFRLSEAIGGVMTPPYEVLRNSPTNGSSNLQPRERIGRSKMCHEHHPTASPEVVRGHRPPGIGKTFPLGGKVARQRRDG